MPTLVSWRSVPARTHSTEHFTFFLTTRIIIEKGSCKGHDEPFQPGLNLFNLGWTVYVYNHTCVVSSRMVGYHWAKGPSIWLLYKHCNSAKSILLVKPDKLQEAQEKFEATGVEIRVIGVRYLGAAIGSPSFKHEYITEKVQMWVAEIKSLSAIAKTQPQAAYAVFVHAMKHKWTFLARTMQEASGLFTELEQAIDIFLIPAMTDRPPVSKEERRILSLPCRNGGLGLINPTQLHHHYQDSAHLTGPLAVALATSLLKLTHWERQQQCLQWESEKHSWRRERGKEQRPSK